MGDTEEWREHPAWPHYLISSKGRVRSLRRRLDGGLREHRNGGILAQQRSNNGYLLVSLSRDKQKRYVLIHRLVLEVFVGPCPPGYETDHVDRDRTNNAIDNLRWIPTAENNARRLLRPVRGENNGQAKLTEIQVREVHALRAQGLIQREIAAQLGVSQTQVGKILCGKCWAHLHPSANG